MLHSRTLLTALLLASWQVTVFAQNVITTIAGTDWLFPGDGKPAINAPLGGSTGMNVAVDRNGNYYIADTDNAMIMRVGGDGVVHVIAGNGVVFFSGDGGPGNAASLTIPLGVAVDTTGNVFIADLAGRVRMVNPAGIISTVAGDGTGLFSGDGGPATKAGISPSSVAVDSSGAVYVLDSDAQRVRKFTPGGNISTVAGNGRSGYTGDGGQAVNATLQSPKAIAVDSAGNLYIADTANGVIRKVNTNGIISTFAGGGFAIDDGIPALATGLIPISVGVDSSNNVYIGDFFTSTVRVVTSDGTIHTVAGTPFVTAFSGDEGPALKASINVPTGIAVDAPGIVYIADSFNDRIRTVTRDGIIHTAAGNGQFRTSGDGGPAVSAALFLPTGVTPDKRGNIFIAEQQRNRVRRVAPDGTISNFAGTAQSGYSGDGGAATNATLFYPTSVAVDASNNVFISDTLNSVIRRVDANSGIISTIAGTGVIGFSGDGGNARNAKLAGPLGIAFDRTGNLFIAEFQGNRIRMVTPAGIISTVAGNGTAGFSGDNGPATAAKMSTPTGVAVDSDGNVFFSDRDNQRIRRFKPGGNITTIAGSGQRGFSGDGGKAVNAALNTPTGLTTDAAGSLYISDAENSRIRKVTADGNINTVVGSQFAGYGGDGGPPASANLAGPNDLAFDSAGNLFIADEFNHRIRAVLATPPAFSASPTSLSFSVSGGTVSPVLNVSLTTSVPGLPYTVTTTSTGGRWLQVTPSTGMMPATLQVSADASNLALGSFTGTITITAPSANPPTRTVSVNLLVLASATNILTVKPTSLSFSFIQQSPATSQVLRVSNQNGLPLRFTAAATTSVGSWLSVSPTVSSGGLTSVTVTANPGILIPGTYAGTITITSPDTGDTLAIPVLMTITAIPQTIQLPQSGLTFITISGAGAAPSQSFAVKNTGRGVMQWTARASTLSGGPWLSISPASGASDAASSSVPLVQVSVDASALSPGSYYGQVQVSAPAADNTPQFVSVALNVLPAGSTPGPIVQPTAVVFSAVAGGESPGSQTLLVSTVTPTAVSFRSAQTTENGKNWFITLPPAANVTQNQPARVVIQPNIAGLGPAVYRGTLTLGFSDGNTRSVAIVLILIPPAAGGSKAFHEAQSDCAPKALIPVFTLLSNGFSIPAGYPNQVAMRVVDDCANPMVSGSNVASFSNGDAALSLSSLQDGNWTATWVGRNGGNQVTVTGTSEMSNPKLEGTAKITGSVQANNQPPVVGSGAILNAASYQLQGPLSPGSYIAIFGSRLSTGQNSASTLPLPTTLGDTTVAIAGQPVPLLYAGDSQINGVLPYGIATNTKLQIAITRGNTLTVPEPLTIAQASPGIFTKSATGVGQGHIYIAGTDGSLTLADASHPLKTGDAAVIYCTGLGEVTPAVAAGAPGPIPPATTNSKVTVSIGGVDAPAFFSGLAPGFAGVYQVNVIVPRGITSGSQVPVVMSAAGQSSPPVTVAVQ